MAFNTAIVFLAVIAVAAASSRYYTRSSGDDSSELRDAQYRYSWTVKARDPAVKSRYGNDDSSEAYGKQATRSSTFGQSETRDGKKTEGRYSVLLPDGRLQTVEYVVDGESGYVAKVSYDKPAYTKTY